MSTPPSPHTGRILDQRYELLSLLAQGGMGTLYRARTVDPEPREVVIKFSRWGAALQSLRQQDPIQAQREERGRVEREFQLLKKASSLSGHVVKVYEPLGDDPLLGLYYPMEFLDGAPLSSLPEWGQPFATEEALSIALQVCEALSIAHGLGVVHRDLNPDNIFLVQEGDCARFVKLIDFGIARDLYQRRETFQTGDDLAFGHFHYMAPEQVGYNAASGSYDTATASTLDHRADLYSLGAILLHLFTGKPPYEDNTIEELAERDWDTPPNLKRALEERLLPLGLQDIISSCLSPSPEERPPDIYSLSAMLQSFLSASEATPSSSSEGEEVHLFEDLQEILDWEEDPTLEESHGSLSELIQREVPSLNGETFDVTELVLDSMESLSSYDSSATFELIKQRPAPLPTDPPVDAPEEPPSPSETAGETISLAPALSKRFPTPAAESNPTHASHERPDTPIHAEPAKQSTKGSSFRASVVTAVLLSSLVALSLFALWWTR